MPCPPRELGGHAEHQQGEEPAQDVLGERRRDQTHRPTPTIETAPTTSAARQRTLP